MIAGAETTLLPVLTGAFGVPYLLSTLLLDGALAWGVWRILAQARRGAAWSGAAWWLYKFSLLYLALLFLAMALDRAWRG